MPFDTNNLFLDCRRVIAKPALVLLVSSVVCFSGCTTPRQAYVSQHPELFASAQGAALDPMPAEIQRFASFFLSMGLPEHTRYRRPISSAFTPRNALRQVGDTMRVEVEKIGVLSNPVVAATR